MPYVFTLSHYNIFVGNGYFLTIHRWSMILWFQWLIARLCQNRVYSDHANTCSIPTMGLTIYLTNRHTTPTHHGTYSKSRKTIFWGAGDGTQGLVHTRSLLHHWATYPAPEDRQPQYLKWILAGLLCRFMDALIWWPRHIVVRNFN
jgi:hypothetical protein